MQQLTEHKNYYNNYYDHFFQDNKLRYRKQYVPRGGEIADRWTCGGDGVDRNSISYF